MANVLAGTFAQALHSPHKTTSSKKRPPYRSYRRRTWPRSKDIWLNGQYWYGPLKMIGLRLAQLKKSGLTKCAKAVFACLNDKHNRKRGFAWPSLKTISALTGFSRRAIQYAIQQLERLKLVVVDRSQKIERSNRYEINYTIADQYLEQGFVPKLQKVAKTATEKLKLHPNIHISLKPFFPLHPREEKLEEHSFTASVDQLWRPPEQSSAEKIFENVMKEIQKREFTPPFCSHRYWSYCALFSNTDFERELKENTAHETEILIRASLQTLNHFITTQDYAQGTLTAAILRHAENQYQ